MMRSVFTVFVIYFGNLNVAVSIVVLNIFFPLHDVFFGFIEMLIRRYYRKLHVAIQAQLVLT
jgi:archaellum biogenesis protein FlaJ (TadC family)